LRIEVSSSSKIEARRLTTENNANDALDLPEPLRIERKAYFNPAISLSMSYPSHVGANSAKRSPVPGIPVGLVLELALTEEVGFHRCRQIEVGAGVVRIERDLEVQVIELVDRRKCRFELQQSALWHSTRSLARSK
jgi:hypothetical protein